MGRDEFFKTLKVGVEFYSTDSLSKLKQKYSEAAKEGAKDAQLLSLLKIAGVSALTSTLTKFIDSFADIVDSAISRVDEMLSYSQMTDSSIRDLKLGYGFSSSQAYGYQTAMDVMGFGSMEDLMYANEQQLSQFRDAFEKYSEKYEELYDAGYFEQLQEYQVEMTEFKLDMQHEVIEFFMNNKDVIKSFMSIMIDFAEFSISALSWIVDFFSNGERSSSERARETQSILNSYTSSSTNVKISNEFNNIAKDDTTWLANAGQMSYQQIIKALT